MRTKFWLLVLSTLLLASCQPSKPITTTKKIEPPPPEIITEGSLTISILETRLVASESKAAESALVEMTVSFTNLGKNRMAILRRGSLDLQVKNQDGKAPKPLAAADNRELTPLDLIQLGPSEDMIVKVFAGPYAVEDLGLKPQISLVASAWALKQIKHRQRFGQGMKVWPLREFQSKPLPLASNEIQKRKMRGGATLEFLNVTSEKDDWWGRPGTRIQARYRISNDGANPILAEDGYPLLNVFASDNKRSYPSPYASVELSMPTIWNMVKIYPGESKTIVDSVLPYYSTEMEETFDFRYEIHPWDLAKIENLPKNLIPKLIKTFPLSVLKSPLYNLDRRH